MGSWPTPPFAVRRSNLNHTRSTGWRAGPEGLRFADIIQSQLELEKQNVTVKYRRNQMFPTLDLTASFGVAAQSQAGGTNYRSGVVWWGLR